MTTSVLILCTGNSCRSQMAEGFLRTYLPSIEVRSAGTDPAAGVHPLAIEVMRECGIDLGSHRPKPVDRFLGRHFDYVVTVCDAARQTCPVFTGTVGRRLHLGFEDPAEAAGGREHQLAVFREVRDKIARDFRKLADEIETGA